MDFDLTQPSILLNGASTEGRTEAAPALDTDAESDPDPEPEEPASDGPTGTTSPSESAVDERRIDIASRDERLSVVDLPQEFDVPTLVDTLMRSDTSETLPKHPGLVAPVRRARKWSLVGVAAELSTLRRDASPGLVGVDYDWLTLVDLADAYEFVLAVSPDETETRLEALLPYLPLVFESPHARGIGSARLFRVDIPAEADPDTEPRNVKTELRVRKGEPLHEVARGPFDFVAFSAPEDWTGPTREILEEFAPVVDALVWDRSEIHVAGFVFESSPVSAADGAPVEDGNRKPGPPDSRERNLPASTETTNGRGNGSSQQSEGPAESESHSSSADERPRRSTDGGDSDRDGSTTSGTPNTSGATTVPADEQGTEAESETADDEGDSGRSETANTCNPDDETAGSANSDAATGDSGTSDTASEAAADADNDGTDDGTADAATDNSETANDDTAGSADDRPRSGNGSTPPDTGRDATDSDRPGTTDSNSESGAEAPESASTTGGTNPAEAETDDGSDAPEPSDGSSGAARPDSSRDTDRERRPEQGPTPGTDTAGRSRSAGGVPDSDSDSDGPSGSASPPSANRGETSASGAQPANSSSSADPGTPELPGVPEGDDEDAEASDDSDSPASESRPDASKVPAGAAPASDPGVVDITTHVLNEVAFHAASTMDSDATAETEVYGTFYENSEGLIRYYHPIDSEEFVRKRRNSVQFTPKFYSFLEHLAEIHGDIDHRLCGDGHSHPGGIPMQSPADKRFSRRIWRNEHNTVFVIGIDDGDGPDEWTVVDDGYEVRRRSNGHLIRVRAFAGGSNEPKEIRIHTDMGG